MITHEGRKLWWRPEHIYTNGRQKKKGEKTSPNSHTLYVDSRDETCRCLYKIVHETIEGHREPIVVRVVAIEWEAIDKDAVERIEEEHPVMNPKHLDFKELIEIASVREEHGEERKVSPMHRNVKEFVGPPIVVG